jgi:hypothetical protein
VAAPNVEEFHGCSAAPVVNAVAVAVAVTFADTSTAVV